MPINAYHSTVPNTFPFLTASLMRKTYVMRRERTIRFLLSVRAGIIGREKRRVDGRWTGVPGRIRIGSMRKLLRAFVPSVVAAVVLLGLADVAQACPGCKESVGDSSLGGGPGGPTPGLPSGFNYSIYFMLAGLFSVLGLVAGIVVKGIRGSDRTPQRQRGFPLV